MSFFDDEGDEPTRAEPRAARPRRPAPAARPATAGGGGAGGRPNPDQVRVRQFTAIGIGVLLLILFVVGINGCLDTRAKNALKDYNRDVTSIVESSRQSSQDLFETLNGGGAANDLQVQVNQIRLQAEEDVTRADALDVPDDMRAAQRNLELTLNLRETAVQTIAEELQNVGASEQAQVAAVGKIAGQMQALLASDVVYSQRVAPLIKEALDEADISDQEIAQSKFLPSIAWLDPANIGDRLGAESGGSSGSSSRDPAPGLHGHGLVSVGVGETALQPGEAVNRIPAGSGLAFAITFANQGDNNEAKVKVKVSITGGGRPITREKTVNQTIAKKNVEVSVPLETAPPIGQAVKVNVEVAKVPGEEKTDNNKQTYTVLFTR